MRKNNWFFQRLFLLLLSGAKYKAKNGERLNILSVKQMLQRLPVGLAQVKAGSNSKNSLNEIRKIAYSFLSKEITRKEENFYTSRSNA